MKKHYLIYQITNLTNNKIYIGKHETYNIDDDYFGSGKLIKRAIKKYGIENFVKTILFELQNQEEMNLLEKAVVTPDFCARKDVYNINIGGNGSWAYINSNSNLNGGNFTDHKKYADLTRAGMKRYWDCLDINERNARCEKATKVLRANSYNWNGKHHTIKTKQKLSNITKRRLHDYPEQNAMLNSVWIMNERCQLSIPVKKDIARQIIKDNDNWQYGKCDDFEKCQQQLNFSIMEKINAKIYLEKQKELYCAFYSFYYQEYLKLGYKQFQLKYQLNIERTALLHLFRKYALGYQRYKRNKYKSKSLI